MRSKWLLFILLIALVIVSGCAEEQADSEDAAAGQVQAPANEEETDGEAASAVGAVQYPVRMEFFGFKPAELDINRGDTVTWRNYNQQKVYTLQSDDDLFEKQEIKYGNLYYHTFEDRGTYTFSIENAPEMNMTVNVR